MSPELSLISWNMIQFERTMKITLNESVPMIFNVISVTRGWMGVQFPEK